MIIPFLGVPQAWRTYAVVALGVCLTLIGYALRRRVYLKEIEQASGERSTNSFVETTETLFKDSTVQ
jgi:hypothetical protein